jgi:hypothetical protein
VCRTGRATGTSVPGYRPAVDRPIRPRHRSEVEPTSERITHSMGNRSGEPWLPVPTSAGESGPRRRSGEHPNGGGQPSESDRCSRNDSAGARRIPRHRRLSAVRAVRCPIPPDPRSRGPEGASLLLAATVPVLPGDSAPATGNTPPNVAEPGRVIRYGASPRSPGNAGPSSPGRSSDARYVYNYSRGRPRARAASGSAGRPRPPPSAPASGPHRGARSTLYGPSVVPRDRSGDVSHPRIESPAASVVTGPAPDPSRGRGGRQTEPLGRPLDTRICG